MATSLSIIYSISDAKGQSSTMEINIPSGTVLASMTAFAASVATLINAVTTGVITRIGIALSVTLPGGLRSAALTNSDVEEGAKLIFNTASGFRTSFRIPTFDEALIASNSRGVDLENADVAAFINAVEDGLTSAGNLVQPTDKRDSDITALTSAKELFLSSRA